MVEDLADNFMFQYGLKQNKSIQNALEESDRLWKSLLCAQGKNKDEAAYFFAKTYLNMIEIPDLKEIMNGGEESSCLELVIRARVRYDALVNAGLLDDIERLSFETFKKSKKESEPKGKIDRIITEKGSRRRSPVSNEGIATSQNENRDLDTMEINYEMLAKNEWNVGSITCLANDTLFYSLEALLENSDVTAGNLRKSLGDLLCKYRYETLPGFYSPVSIEAFNSTEVKFKDYDDYVNLMVTDGAPGEIEIALLSNSLRRTIYCYELNNQNYKRYRQFVFPEENTRPLCILRASRGKYKPLTLK